MYALFTPEGHCVWAGTDLSQMPCPWQYGDSIILDRRNRSWPKEGPY